MRRSKKASLPASAATPALRRRTASAAKESPSRLGPPASGGLLPQQQQQQQQQQLPERKAAAAAAATGGAIIRADQGRSSPSPRLAPHDPREATAPLPAGRPPPLPPPLPPPPLLVSGGAGGGPGARGLALEAGAMLGIFRSIPTQMDYKGQKLAEQIFQGIILFSAVVGFIYGYIAEQFGWTVYIVMAGFALSCLLTLPPWPIYRRNPLKWLPVQESTTDDKKPADRKVKRHPKN